MKVAALLAACVSVTTAAPALFLNTTISAGLHLPPLPPAPHVPHVPLPRGINLNLTAIAKAALVTRDLNVTVGLDVDVDLDAKKPKTGIPSKRFRPQKRTPKAPAGNPYTVITVNATFTGN